MIRPVGINNSSKSMARPKEFKVSFNSVSLKLIKLSKVSTLFGSSNDFWRDAGFSSFASLDSTGLIK